VFANEQRFEFEEGMEHRLQAAAVDPFLLASLLETFPHGRSE
jgi:hypothetical protein